MVVLGSTMAGVQSIAHRGASGHCPENTLAAFRRAIELGADMIETDAQLSRDGVVFLCHDETLNRTTNGRGEVAHRTAAELKRLDAGSWFDTAFRKERIPTLEEAILAIRGRVSLNVELKTGHDAPGLLERETIGLLASHRILDDTVISSFSGRRIRAARQISPRARLAVLVERRSRLPRAFELARELRAEAIHPWKNLVTRDFVRKAHGRGLAIRAWSVNTPAEIERLRALGVDGIVTDFPERVAGAP